MQQTPAVSKFACFLPFIEHADTNEQQHVDIFTQSTLLDQPQRHRHKCFSFVNVKTNVSIVAVNQKPVLQFILLNFAENPDRGQINLRLP